MAQLSRTSTAEKPIPRLDCLPGEVVQQILRALDAPSLVSISFVSRKFHAAADEHLLWKDRVLNDFVYWDHRHEIAEKKANPSFREWKDLYAVRHTANVATQKALKLIINQPLGRLNKIERVIHHGYGVKEPLLNLYQSAASTDHPLAQRYYSKVMLACLNRSIALEQWNKVKLRSNIKNATELALAGFDMFVLGHQAVGDIDDTFRRLNGYVQAVREAHPHIDEQSPRDKATTVARFLRRKKWVGIDEGRDYYSIENQFLGLALRSNHRNSLPLLSCIIYCYVARQFNLRAQPCNYPMHVHALIQPPLPAPGEPAIDLDGRCVEPDDRPNTTSSDATDTNTTTTNPEIPTDRTHLYIDPFNSDEPVPLNYLRQQLNFIAPTANSELKASWLRPADARSLVVRSAHNIIRALQQIPFDRTPPRVAAPGNPELNPHDAAYAALFALVMFPATPAELSDAIGNLRHYFGTLFREDLFNFETYVLPLTSGMGSFGGDVELRDLIVDLVRREDVTPKRPKRRAEIETSRASDGSDEKEVIKYSVGTVFRHRRQGYIAVIYGWDGRCEMQEQWILGNGVDRLPRGRGQPFYNAFVMDRSTRYVAQENIIPLGPDDFTAEDAERVFSWEVGKWFLRFDPESARFVSNVRDEYPED